MYLANNVYISIFFIDFSHHISIPVRTDEDFVVHMFRLNDTSYKNFHIDAIAKLCFMLVDITLNAKTPPRGLKVVIDAKGVSYSPFIHKASQ